MVRYGGKDAPEVPQPITDTAQEIAAREAAGWALKEGFPVVFNENYEVGAFTYYANVKVTPGGKVWRIPTKNLP
jgi:hypothetical protein